MITTTSYLFNIACICSYNYYGQLGLGNTLATTTFTQVNGINNIHLISCGDYHTFIYNNEGLYACGSNSKGQINGNDSTTFTNRLPIDSTYEYTLKLKLWQFLFNMELPVTGSMSIEEMLEVLVNKGDHLEDVLDDVKDSLVSLMQEGGYYLKGDEDISSLISILEKSGICFGDVKQVACGYAHTFIVKNDGSLWSCGWNRYGELGLGDTTRRTTFTQVTTNINNDVDQIACGSYHNILRKKDGSIWVCGYNEYGQLGLGDTTNRKTFTQVTTNTSSVKEIICGSNHSVLLKTDNRIWSCGQNNYGQLGLGSTTNKNTFTQVTTNISNDVKQVSCKGGQTFVLKTNGSVWSCGFNDDGQLGLGNTTNKNTFTQVTSNINNDVQQIACGYNHTFILKTNGTVWSCGYDGYGQLGLGGAILAYAFSQVTTNINNDVKQVICGNDYTYILKNDGSIWSCGQNGYGQLGLGDTTIRKTFTQVLQSSTRASVEKPGENTGENTGVVKQIACGYICAFILKNNGSIWACGGNSYGQLGSDDPIERLTFTQVDSNNSI